MNVKNDNFVNVKNHNFVNVKNHNFVNVLNYHKCKDWQVKRSGSPSVHSCINIAKTMMTVFVTPMAI